MNLSNSKDIQLKIEQEAKKESIYVNDHLNVHEQKVGSCSIYPLLVWLKLHIEIHESKAFFNDLQLSFIKKCTIDLTQIMIDNDPIKNALKLDFKKNEASNAAAAIDPDGVNDLKPVDIYTIVNKLVSWGQLILKSNGTDIFANINSQDKNEHLKSK